MNNNIKIEDYEIVIGLEIHVELCTRSKIFCSCSTAFGGEPNTHCCPICIGMPGVLPVLNKEAVIFAIKAGLAINCTIPAFSKLDRKNYFYPDLPKAYQVSQYDLPLCKNGHVTINLEGYKKKIAITRIHIEEDAGKLLHDEWESGSLIDYNRCGVPLIEIVSEPDMRCAEEVRLYIEYIKSILQFLEVSDCKMQEGSLRTDVNLSVRPRGNTDYGIRTEMKNLNSIKAIIRAIDAESKRQISILQNGGIIIQETRRWDDDKGISYSMRSKEDAHDYRYFPEPDLLPISFTPEFISKLKQSLPELPEARRKRYIETLGLPEYDSWLLTSSKNISSYFEDTNRLSGNAKSSSNWIMGEIMRLLNEKEIEAPELLISSEGLAELIILVDKGTINTTIAKRVFQKVLESGKSPKTIVDEEGLQVVNDEKMIKEIIKKIISINPQSIIDIKNGKEKAIGFLVGQVMKESKGSANPQILNSLIKEELGLR